MERPGVFAGQPADLRVERRGYAVSDIQYFDRWDTDGWQEHAPATRWLVCLKTATAVSSLTISADGKFLYALNYSDDHLYILETHGGRAVARVNVGDHPLSAKLSKDAKSSTWRISAAPAWRSST